MGHSSSLRLGLLLSLFALALGTRLVAAFDVQGSISFNTLIANPSVLPIGSKVSLDHGSRYAYITSEGKFNLPNVDEGKHILEALIPGYIMESLLLNINETIHVQNFHPARAPLPTTTPSLPYPIILRPVAKEEYFVNPGGLNVLGLLKNPMVLISLVSGVMMFGLPKLQAMMDDPEIKEEMAAAQRQMKGFQNSNFVGSLSNVLAGDEAGSTASSTRAGTPSKANVGGGGKKRKGK